jgi:hypothetical protein
MKYQIIGTLEDNRSYVIYNFSDLSLAKSVLKFAVEVAADDVNHLMKLPSWKSIELQQVETISVFQIEDEHER